MHVQLQCRVYRQISSRPERQWSHGAPSHRLQSQRAQREDATGHALRTCRRQDMHMFVSVMPLQMPLWIALLMCSFQVRRCW